MRNLNKLSKGILFALLTSIISGFSIFFTKISVAKIDPLILATTRNLYVGLIFVALFLVGGKIKELKSLSRRELILLILIGIIGGSIPFYMFFTGVALVGAQTANVIHKTLFIWVALLSAVFIREKINIAFIIAGLLVFAGNFLFIPIKFHFGQGEQLILLATLLWAVENILAKKVLAKKSSEMVGLFRMLLGGGLLLFITFATGKGTALLRLNPSQLTVIVIGASLLFFYVFTWYKALKNAPAGLVTLILTFSLVVGNALGGAFAGVKLLPNDIFSMICIAGGVALLALTKLLMNARHSKA